MAVGLALEQSMIYEAQQERNAVQTQWL